MKKSVLRNLLLSRSFVRSLAQSKLQHKQLLEEERNSATDWLTIRYFLQQSQKKLAEEKNPMRDQAENK